MVGCVVRPIWRTITHHTQLLSPGWPFAGLLPIHHSRHPFRGAQEGYPWSGTWCCNLDVLTYICANVTVHALTQSPSSTNARPTPQKQETVHVAFTNPRYSYDWTLSVTLTTRLKSSTGKGYSAPKTVRATCTRSYGDVVDEEGYVVGEKLYALVMGLLAGMDGGKKDA
jgi:hypothetical protein